MTQIALFPIPGCVLFPGTSFPLHVFEPRYRTMVKHCVEHAMPLGICHTQKVVHPGKARQSAQEALASNQATYKPCDIFSAGMCDIKEELEDGRMLIRVHAKNRYRLVREVQTLPFSIYECDIVDDVAEADAESMALVKEKLLKRLIAITSHMPEVVELLKSDAWRNKAPLDFSFEIFGVLRLDAPILQAMLEIRDPLQRLEKTLAYLNK